MDTRRPISSVPVGQQLRRWRLQRHLSQLDLALQADISARHLSFVETGRAQPGRELVLRLAEELEIPLRARNALLVTAGFAPVFESRPFSDPGFDPIRAIIDLTLERHRPFPAYLVDRHWNVQRSNMAVPELYEGVSDTLMRAPLNVVRLVLHPDGMAPRVLNYATWRAHYLGLLRRQIEMTADPQLEFLLREVLAYPEGRKLDETLMVAGPAVPLVVQTRLGRLSFIGATTIFGSPADVTLEEVALEVLHPADDFTETAVRAGSGTKKPVQAARA